MKGTFSIIVIGLSLQSCTSTLKLNPTAMEGQHQVFQDGVETVVSTKDMIVYIRPTSKSYISEKRPSMVVSVFNASDKPFNFSSENVQVFVDGQPLKIFSHDELVAEIKKKQAWAELNSSSQSMNATNAGSTYNSGTRNATAYSSNGNVTRLSGPYSGYSYSAAQVQAIVDARTKDYMNRINSEAIQAIANLDNVLLKKTTVFPGAWHSGQVTLAKVPNFNEPHDIRVLVNAGDEEHEFRVNHLNMTTK